MTIFEGFICINPSFQGFICINPSFEGFICINPSFQGFICINPSFQGFICINPSFQGFICINPSFQVFMQINQRDLYALFIKPFINILIFWVPINLFLTKLNSLGQIELCISNNQGFNAT